MSNEETRAMEMAQRAAASRAAARQALEAYQETLRCGADPTQPYEVMNALYEKAREDTFTFINLASFSDG